jgi:hypothetical protein
MKKQKVLSKQKLSLFSNPCLFSEITSKGIECTVYVLEGYLILNMGHSDFCPGLLAWWLFSIKFEPILGQFPSLGQKYLKLFDFSGVLFAEWWMGLSK